MATSSSRMISRLTTRLVIKLNKTPSTSPFFTPLLKPRSTLSRLPVELSCCLETMLPLHSAIASARLTSSLSIESQSWGIVPQVLPLHKPFIFNRCRVELLCKHLSLLDVNQSLTGGSHEIIECPVINMSEGKQSNNDGVANIRSSSEPYKAPLVSLLPYLNATNE